MKEIGENVLVLYDNIQLLLEIEAFCRIVKRIKDLIRKKNVKIMNQLASVKKLGVFVTIHSKICEKKSQVTLLADPMTISMECDERLAMNPQHYTEDVIIDFEKIMQENKLLDVCDYWVKAKTVKEKCYLPL